MSDKLDSQHIDRLVGFHVMEWTFRHGAEGSWYEYDNLVATEDWSPSTDITDAWQVLGQFMEETYEINIIHTNTGWYCSIGHLQELKHIATANSPPMAICLAALKAVDVDVTEFV